MIKHSKVNGVVDVYIFPSRSTKQKHVIHYESAKFRYYCSCPKKVWNSDKCRHIKILEFTLKNEPELIIEVPFEEIQDFI